MRRKLLVSIMIFLMMVGFCGSVFAGQPDYYSIIFNEVRHTAPGLGIEGADWVTRAILWSCGNWNVDPILVAAVFRQESGYNMNSVSPAGAIGIAQLMPETAASLGVNPYNALENVDGGVHYLRMQLDRFAHKGKWSTTYAVAAYNAGPGAVKQYDGVPPYRETIEYVNAISRIYQNIQWRKQ